MSQPSSSPAPLSERESRPDHTLNTPKPSAMTSLTNIVSAHPDLERGRNSPGGSEERRVTFNGFTLAFLAFTIMSSYQTWAGTVATSLYSGGPVTMVYGYVLACLGSLAGAASLAELVSAWPTAEGQINWAENLAPESCASFVRYYTAWATVFGWTFIGCSAAFVFANALTGVAMFTHLEYMPERWHTALMLWGVVLLALVINIFAFRILGIGTLVVLIVILLARHEGPFNEPSFVFGHFINETGWDSDGIAFFLGLVGSAFSVIGYDAVAHMAEEMAEPEKQAPRAMLAAVLMSLPTGLPFILVLLFVIKDIDYLATLPYPIVEIIEKSVRNKAGTVFLTFCVALTAPVATTSILATAGRVVWSFALEGGIPFSQWFSRLSSRYEVPVNALCVVAAVQCLLSLIYIGNTALFNSILTLTVAFLNISYSIPIALMLFRGRPQRLLPAAPFRLGAILGPLCNIVALCVQTVVSFFLFFPNTLPTTAETMNWACVIFAGAHLVLGIYWFYGGRKAAHVIHEAHELHRQATEGGEHDEDASPKRR
ncbi:hypothetical protein JCM6882_008439 [Rhodosporidiobolus microsporus]